MYQERIVLTSKDILEKDFKIDTRGYRPQEVDRYLDTIIKDYEEMNSIINELDSDKKELLEDNEDNLRERFVFSVDAQYCSAVWGDMGKSGVVELPSFLDLEARMTYVYNRRFSFYLKGDNLINATIQHIPGYVEPGINFGLGVCCKF